MPPPPGMCGAGRRAHGRRRSVERPSHLPSPACRFEFDAPPDLVAWECDCEPCDLACRRARAGCVPPIPPPPPHPAALESTAWRAATLACRQHLCDEAQHPRHRARGRLPPAARRRQPQLLSGAGALLPHRAGCSAASASIASSLTLSSHNAHLSPTPAVQHEDSAPPVLQHLRHLPLLSPPQQPRRLRRRGGRAQGRDDWLRTAFPLRP